MSLHYEDPDDKPLFEKDLGDSDVNDSGLLPDQDHILTDSVLPRLPQLPESELDQLLDTPSKHMLFRALEDSDGTKREIHHQLPDPPLDLHFGNQESPLPPQLQPGIISPRSYQQRRSMLQFFGNPPPAKRTPVRPSNLKTWVVYDRASDANFAIVNMAHWAKDNLPFLDQNGKYKYPSGFIRRPSLAERAEFERYRAIEMFRTRTNVVDETSLVRLGSPEQGIPDNSREIRLHLLQTLVEVGIVYAHFASGQYEPCNLGRLWANFQKRASRELFYLIILHLLQTGRYRGMKSRSSLLIECLSPTPFEDEAPFSCSPEIDVLDEDEPYQKLEPPAKRQKMPDYPSLLDVEMTWTMLDKSQTGPVRPELDSTQYTQMSTEEPRNKDSNEAKLPILAFLLFYAEQRPTFVDPTRTEPEIGREIGLRWLALTDDLKTAYLAAAASQKEPKTNHRRTCQWEGCTARGADVRRTRFNGRRLALCAMHLPPAEGKADKPRLRLETIPRADVGEIRTADSGIRPDGLSLTEYLDFVKLAGPSQTSPKWGSGERT